MNSVIIIVSSLHVLLMDTSTLYALGRNPGIIRVDILNFFFKLSRDEKHKSHAYWLAAYLAITVL